MRRIITTFGLLLLCGSAVLTGCGGGVALDGSTGPITLTVASTTAVLTPGSTQTFSATVTNTPVTTVVWAVAGGSRNGTITNTGLYTAPMTPGTYKILAISAADLSVSVTITVTVRAV